VGRRAQGRWECRQSCLQECHIHMMSRAQTRHLEEMAGLASTTFTTRRRKPPALLFCGLVGWLDTGGQFGRRVGRRACYLGLFGSVISVSAGVQPDSDRKRQLLGSTVNRLDQARSWAPFCSTTSLTNLNPPPTRHVGHAKTLIFVGVTQCETIQHCYLKETTTISARNRCANQHLGVCLASDWDLSVKRKGKALVDEGVRSSQTVLCIIPKQPIPVVRD